MRSLGVLVLLVLAQGRSQVLNVVVPMHREYASLGVLLHCLLAQTDDRWRLLVVSDGPDASARSVLASMLGLFPGAEGKVQYLETEARARDGGHTPRALGLATLQGGWTVLSGVDNYYVPLFVEYVLRAVEDNPSAGLVYWDFVLDRKGNEDYNAKVARALELDQRGHQEQGEHSEMPEEEVAMSLPVDVGGDAAVLFRFGASDDLDARARDFVRRHGLASGGGCESEDCVHGALVQAARAAIEAGVGNPEQAQNQFRLPERYEGHVHAKLALGQVDMGAFAFRTDLGQAAGFTDRHHSADWAFCEKILQRARESNKVAVHLPRVLYVHN